MGRVAIRQGIANTITNAAVPYVGTVYPARPVIMEETAYTQTLLGQAVAQTPNASSAVLVVNLPSDTRRRIADTGRGSVNDKVIHHVALEVFFASVAGDGANAQSDYDGIIDALVILIRANPTMGGGSWSAGEYTAGIDHAQTQPYTSEDGLTIFIAGALRFEAWEMAVGAAGSV